MTSVPRLPVNSSARITSAECSARVTRDTDTTARDTKSGRSRTAWVRRKNAFLAPGDVLCSDTSALCWICCGSRARSEELLQALIPPLKSLDSWDGVVFGLSLGTLAFIMFSKTNKVQRWLSGAVISLSLTERRNTS